MAADIGLQTKIIDSWSCSCCGGVHWFSFCPGTREDRAVASLMSMGPAVINGGITTFLALVLLGFSHSHVFITFFKVIISSGLSHVYHCNCWTRCSGIKHTGVCSNSCDLKLECHKLFHLALWIDGRCWFLNTAKLKLWYPTVLMLPQSNSFASLRPLDEPPRSLVMSL